MCYRPPVSARKYDLLALDLDGTLFAPDGRVTEANVAAVRRARDDGMTVVLCTGRGFVESGSAVRAVDAHRPAAGRAIAPMITAGGAMVVDAASGRTIHRWAMGRELVAGLCDHFARAGRAPIILKDRDAAGFDYLVVNSGPIEAPTQWWFQVMDVEVRFIDHIEHDPHPEHTVRVGFAAVTETMRSLARSVRAEFGERTMMQHFAAVSGNSHEAHGGKDETVHLLEVFDPQVSKWTAIHRLALEMGIARDRIAAIGDEVNDVAMIEGAALGVAMGNAVDEVKAVAARHTESNAEDGVARAIERILSGEW